MDKALELGINMIGISEHESLSSHIRVNKYGLKLQEQHPDFKTMLCNEIYLTENRDKGQKYYHFLLGAKNAQGHQMLREASSVAWLNGYFDRGLQRVPLLYEELAEIIKKYGKGNLIASSACIGSIIGQQILAMKKAETVGDINGRKEAHDKIVQHVLFCKEWFDDDFYFEIAPATYQDQIYVNKKTLELCKVFDVKATVQDDSHRLTQKDFIAHKALLNSKQGERESIESFYGFTYLQSYDDIRKHLEPVGCNVDELFANSMEIYDKVEMYSLLHNQQVPQVSVPDFPKVKGNTGYQHLDSLLESDNQQERYWVNFCLDKMKEKDIYNETYLSELDNEARIQKVVGEKLNTCIFSYPIFLQHYFDLIWECGGCIGTGRGSSSAGLDNYLMNLTQYDPIKAGVNNYFRYLNENRFELPDLDFDLPPTVRPKWFQKIREERGSLGLIQVCTFSTMSSRAAILSSCRGYRSEDYPNGIDVDTAQYLTSLVGSQRGFTYSIKDMIEGNKEKGIQPNKIFINEVNKYEGLLDIIKKLEGTVSSRSIHASGCVFNDPGHEFDKGAIMTAPDGTLITQWSLHDAEAAGFVKVDALVTDIMEKITQCLLLLQDKNKIEQDLSLKELYDKYIHPDILPIDDPSIWKAIDNVEVLSLFQFDTQVGSQAVKKLKPQNVKELSAINALIRLMAQEKGSETPVDRYYRIKHHPEQWDEEMNKASVPLEYQKIIKEYCGHTYGTLPLQDDLMLMMMDERLFGFDLETTNSARKIIGKKLMDKIPELRNKVLQKAKTPEVGRYIWDVLFSQELGYAFNAEHTYSYSLIGVQCAYLATYFPSIFWNTACLRVDAGLEDDTSSNYGKIAKAVGNIIHRGISVSLIDINKSEYMFEPDLENNTILYSLKALSNVNGDIIEEIINNRPYTSLADFQKKVKANKKVMISLIKSGAFDQFAPREEVMKEYIWTQCEPKKRITLQNFNGLMERNLIPESLNWEKRLFVFNKALRKNCKVTNYYIIQDNYYDFYEQFFDIDLLEPCGDTIGISQKIWQKLYSNGMDKARDYFKEHQQELLDSLNNTLFQEIYDKYALGNLADWEMDSLAFYYHEHPLAHIKKYEYNIKEYNELPSSPKIAKTFRRGEKVFHTFETCRIVGTVIAKDDTKSCISLLTVKSGVVTVKMSRDYYARLNKQISEMQADGKKKVMEKSWFTRGTMLMINGFARGGMFFSKSYKNQNSHQVYKIININDDNTIETVWQRYGEE